MGYGNGNLKDLLFIGSICLIAGLTKAGNNDEIKFQCHPGWTNINYMCYKSVNKTVPWDVARDYCKSLQSELVKVPDYWTNKEIGAEALKNGLSDYWIGFSLLEVPRSSGNAQWSDREESDTKHGYWADYNPDPNNGKCSYETQINEDPKWELGNCNAEKAFVCEKPACTVDTFMCRNSRCIGTNQKCDGKDDCQDGTDEENCPKLCRFYETGSSGNLTSVNFPQNYPANSFCLWKIKADMGTSINLKFSDFITEANTDVIEIFVGSLSESDAFLKYRLSGNTIAQKTYTSPNNMMVVKFTSDSSTEFKGFAAEWTTSSSNLKSSEMNAYPGGNLTVSNFMNNEQKTFTLRSVTRRDIITLEKLHMDISDGDEVVVFDGDSLDSPILATYKGSGADSMGPTFIQSTGEAMQILLKGRGLFANGGFTFSYVQGCKINVRDQISGVIMSPGYDLGKNYPNSLNCEWNIDIPTDQSYSIKFDSNYDIANPDDILYVYNIANSKSVLIFNSTASASAPTILKIHNGTVKVTFNSNAVGSNKGFKADFSVDCPDPGFNANTEITPSNSKWHYKSKFNVSCKAGYGFYYEEFATNSSTEEAFESQTPIEMICLKDGKWNVQTIPQCSKKYCGPVQSIQNGHVLNATGARVGDIAFYTCSDGYTIKGKASAKCQENGKWEAVPICTATGCSSPSNITNGLVNITEGTGTSVGSIALYTCDFGYEIDGVPISQCDKSGKWSHPPPRCQILKCSAVCLEEKIPNAKFAPIGDVDFGTSKNVSCENGYSLNGTSTITCLGDQSFGKLPQCEDIDECKSPPNSNDCTQTCINTVGSYYCECKKGFQMEADNVTCTDIDECATNKGNCEQICKNIPGSYECECEKGFVLYTSDNTMNYSIPTGESGKSVGNVFYLNHSCVPVLCPKIENLANGNIQPQRKFSHFGDTFYFSCNIGFELTGDKSAVCLQTGNWSSNLPMCKGITCPSPDGKPAVPYKDFYNFTCEVRGKPKEYRQRQCLYDPITNSYKLLGDSYVCEEIDCGQPKSIPGALPVNVTNTTYGSQYKVKCSNLYRFKGNTSNGDMVYCSNDGKWDYGDIKCDGVTCKFPPVPIEGSANVTGFTEGSIATYTCSREGYAPHSITQRKCVKNSNKTDLEWDQHTPTCVDVQPPTIKSGSCNASITLEKYSQLNLTPPDFVDNSGHVTVEIEPKEAIKGYIVTKNMTIVYTATDAAGHSFSCQKIITVEDRPLHVTCPPNLVVELATSSDKLKIVFNESDVTVTGPGSSHSISFTPKQLNLNTTNMNGIEPVVVEASTGTKSVNCTFYVLIKAKSCSALSTPNVQHAVWSSTGSTDEFTCKTSYSFPEPTMKTKMAVGCNSTWNTAYTSCSKLETYAKFYGKMTFTYKYGAGDFTDECAREAQSVLLERLSNISTNPCSGFAIKALPTPVNSTFEYTRNASKITFNGWMRNKADVVLPTYIENMCLTTFRNHLNDPIYLLHANFKELTLTNCTSVVYDAITIQVFAKCSNTSSIVEVKRYTYCVPCPPGSYYDLSSGDVTCKLCPIGEYQDKEDQPSCNKCPPNTSTYSTGGYSLNMCKPKCPVGFFSLTGVPPCKPCPVNTYSANTTNCESCPSDMKGREQAAQTIDVCKAQCKAGTFSSDGYEPCHSCPKGFYTNLKNQTECLECDVNTTTSETGANNKSLCLSVEQVLCTPNPCTNGQCVAVDHLFKCVCSSGFTGELCDAAVDPCLPNPCYYGGTCSKDGSGYKCNCPAGTNGKNCEIIIENCKNDTCKNNGICRNKINATQCYCTPGYESEFCEKVSLPCEKNPCQNGMCKNLGTENFKCDCKPGYKGETCDIQIENCASSPCLFNAPCTNLVNDFSCKCPNGYSGKTCSQRANLCSKVNCNVGTCIQNFRQETYTCSCDEGYTYGEYCQLSMETNNGTATGFYKQSTTNNASASCIDECLKDTQCKSVSYNDANKSCSFYTGQTDGCCQIFTKECQNPTDNFWTPWYPIKGSVEPSKILEMLNDVGLNVCKGHVTSLTQCKMEKTEDDKMRPDKYDVSLDLSNPCKVKNLNCVTGNENECSMYRIRFQCAISKVMHNNQCEKKSPCHDVHCKNGGTCAAATKTCDCAKTYQPPFCRVPTDFCSGKSCGNGTCVNGIYNATCDCHSGFKGPDCTNINDCKNNPCSATGTKASGCEDLINDYYCPCKAGFQGKNCEENIDECRCKPCLHKGVCKDEVADFSCECPDGWTGKRCEKIEESCKIDSCANNGVCLNLFKTKYCRCQPNTYGPDCSDSVSICKDANPCINAFNCTEFGGKSTCTCKKGYTGVGCEIVVDFCKSKVCANDGKCINKKDGYMCECKKGFKGLQCEQETNDCTTSMNTCVEPKPNMCPLGKTGQACTKDVSNNYDMEFYLHEKNGMAALKSAVFVPSPSFSISLWVQFKEKNGEGTFFNLFMIKSEGINEEKIPVLRLSNVGITYAPASGGPEVMVKTKTLPMNDGKWHVFSISISNSGRSIDLRLNNFNSFETVTEPIINFFDKKCIVILGCFYDPMTDMALVGKGFYGELSQVNLYNKSLDVTTDLFQLVSKPMESIGDILAGWGDYKLMRGVRRNAYSAKNIFTGVQTFIDVKSCPKMVNNYGSQGRTLLKWTPPQFTDNSQIKVNYRLGTNVLWGRYAVTYEAKDESGNVSLCNFKVYAKEKNCTKPDDPYEGTAVCTDEQFPYYSCKITCNQGKALTKPAPLLFTCGPTGWWHPNEYYLPMRFPTCGDIKPVMIYITMNLEYLIRSTNCDVVETAMKKSLIETMVALNAQNDNVLCSMNDCSDIKWKFICDEKLNAAQDFKVNAVINTMNSSAESILRKAALDDKNFDYSSIVGGGHLQRNQFYLNTIQSCNTIGVALVQGKCVECTAGTFLNASTQQCDSCPVGTYQENVAQTSCVLCPANTTTLGTGHMNISDCKKKCQPGEFFDMQTDKCTECDIVSYQNLEGQFFCKPCLSGKSTQTLGAKAENQCTETCEAGYEFTTNCTACQIGYYREANTANTCVKCSNNTITPSIGSTSESQCNITACPVGTYLHETSNNCTACQVGEYQDEINQKSCKPCPSRNYRTDGRGSKKLSDCYFYCESGFEANNKTCESCPKGTYKNNDESYKDPCKPCPSTKTTLTINSTSESDCKIHKCPPGQQPNTTGDGCELCPLGTYQPKEDEPECIKCNANYSTRADGSINSTSCDAFCESGYERVSGNASLCKECEIGYFKDNSLGLFMKCQLCSNGKITETMASTSEQNCTKANCSAGQYLKPTENDCLECDYGFYQDEKWMTSCKPCPTNSTTYMKGADKDTLCLPSCNPGYGLVEKKCKLCPIGYFNNIADPNQKSCSICPDPEFVTPEEGAISAANCTIRNCTAGTYLHSPNNTCLPCPMDTYQDVSFQQNCKPCGSGFKTWEIGSTSCVRTCPAGEEYKNNVCTKCEIGYYRKTDTKMCILCPNKFLTEEEGAKDESFCTIPPCFVGTFYNGNNCQKCPKNSYQDKRHQKSCMRCPNGYYTTAEGSKVLSDCLSYCTTNAHNCTANSTCIDDETKGFKCDCKGNFIHKGNQCLHICDLDYCQNGGTCSRGETASCICTKYYAGDKCERRLSAKDISENNTDAIIGAVVGVLAGILIIILIVTYVCVRMRNPKSSSFTENSVYGGTLSTKYSPSYLPVESLPSQPIYTEPQVSSFTNAAYDEDSDPAIFRV